MRGEKRDLHQSSTIVQTEFTSGHNCEEKYRQRQHNELTDGVFTKAKHSVRESMVLTGFKTMNDGVLLPTVTAQAPFFAPV
jgi:hypothetical protein